MDNMNMPNLGVVKGLLAVIGGVVLVFFAFKMIFQIACFVTGFLLIYYGLALLNIKQATDYIDFFLVKIRKLFGK
ncbi:hypothetical protein K2X40_05500 [Candidatus Babeliales bacterium]|nr:hypothetical protein [Candidatus Babeliales bacterium]